MSATAFPREERLGLPLSVRHSKETLPGGEIDPPDLPARLSPLSSHHGEIAAHFEEIAFCREIITVPRMSAPSDNRDSFPWIAIPSHQSFSGLSDTFPRFHGAPLIVSCTTTTANHQPYFIPTTSPLPILPIWLPAAIHPVKTDWRRQMEFRRKDSLAKSPNKPAAEVDICGFCHAITRCLTVAGTETPMPRSARDKIRRQHRSRPGRGAPRKRLRPGTRNRG